MSSEFVDWCTPISETAIMRPLHREDVASVASVVEKAFQSPDLGHEVLEQLDIYCDCGLETQRMEEQRDGMPREYYVIAEAGTGAVAGVAGLYRFGLWTCARVLWLGWFAIDPDRHGEGVGGAALSFIMRLARSRGAETLKVETLAGGAAVNFYRRYAFRDEATLRDHYGPGMHALVLARPLDDVEPLAPDALTADSR